MGTATTTGVEMITGAGAMMGEGAADDDRVDELSNRALRDPFPFELPFVESCRGVAEGEGRTGGGKAAAALLSALALSVWMQGRS